MCQIGLAMINKLRPELAGKILIGISSALIVFHVLNLMGLIPLNITWLGHINSDPTMLIMGLLSIFINGVVFLCAMVKCNYVTSIFLRSCVERILPFVFWWLVGNTVANLFSVSIFEAIVFTPILVVLTICIYVIKNQDVSQDVVS